MAKTPNTGHSSGSGSGSGSGTGGTGGTGGAKSQFFTALGKTMAKKGWKTLTIPGFDWAAVETAHFDLDTVFGAFDADSTGMLEGAHLKLSRWADKEKLPETRIALAVFHAATEDQIQYIIKELQKGNRMGVQSMTAVIDLKSGKVFEPQEGSGPGGQRIRINKPVFDQLREVVEVLAAGF